MKKKIPTLLTITAVSFTAILLLLELSSLGEDWAHFADKFYLNQFLAVIGIVFAAGLVLGVFLFRNKLYYDRIKLTIPIACLVVNLYCFYKVIDYYYGLSEQYNYFSAKEDLRNGKVQILFAGQLAENESEKATKSKDSLRRLFGFTYLNVGINSSGLLRYNEVVSDFLTTRNGIGWEKRLGSKIDSVDKIHQKR